jgi:hypothetical protein
MTGAKKKDESQDALKPPTRKLSSKSMSDTAHDGQDLSCSSGDVESSDDESVQRSAPRRTLSGPKRGRLTTSKSLPVQKRNQKQKKSPTKSTRRRSPSEPKRGKLTATKSMPVQKRNRAEPSTDVKKQKKATTKPGNSDKPQKPPPRLSPSEPKRGKLTATKNMPVQKRNVKRIERTKSMPVGQTKKATTKTGNSDKPQKPSPSRSPSEPKRGKLTATKSMPVQKCNVKRTERTKSMPVGQTKKATTKTGNGDKPQKLTPRRSSTVPKRGKLSTERTKSMPVGQTKKWKKKLTVEKKRGIRPSKSMPILKKKTKSKPESSSSVMKLEDMVHDTSDSDSDDSSSSSEGSSSTNSAPADMAYTLEQIRQKSSWKSHTSQKKSNSIRSYGKAGKIQFGGLSNVAE